MPVRDRHLTRVVFHSILFFIFLNISAYAEEKRIEGNYFNIYYYYGLNPLEIAQRLDFSSPHLQIGTNYLKNGSNNPEAILAKTLDALFLEVSDILDIHLYSFKGSLRILRDFKTLDSEFYKLYRMNLKAPSFYIYETNTIYISLDNLRVGILGHEIAHAIMNNYFVVPPPMKLQEVLSGYVEYTLQKKSR
ncbi:MAG: hypothetical protein NC818_06310 [Candidatus Omnitrophica bacterium]|nr:hypothetical protein [Candidatus Omnitrophota bacterium]